MKKWSFEGFIERVIFLPSSIVAFGLILAINFVCVPNTEMTSPSSASISSIASVWTGFISLYKCIYVSEPNCSNNETSIFISSLNSFLFAYTESSNASGLIPKTISLPSYYLSDSGASLTNILSSPKVKLEPLEDVSTVAYTKFIEGLPMKPATKIFFGYR